MQITIRVNGSLLTSLGRPRLYVETAENTTVAELQQQLQREYPAQADSFRIAVPVAAGKHLTPETRLLANQEVAFLIPLAGG